MASQNAVLEVGARLKLGWRSAEMDANDAEHAKGVGSSSGGLAAFLFCKKGGVVDIFEKRGGRRREEGDAF